MYINDFFIPENYRWNEEGKLRKDMSMWAVQQFIITNVEILLFIILAYLFNKWYLKKTLSLDDAMRAKLVIGTAIISFVVMFIDNYMTFKSIFLR